MNNILTRNIYGKLSTLVIGIIIYLGLQIFSMTLLREMYVFGWMADHLYCFTWAAVIVLIVFDQTLLAKFVTFGTAAATIVGEALGGFITQRRMSGITDNMTIEEIELRRINYGVLPIWFITLAIIVTAGIVVSIIVNKKASRTSK